MPSALPGTGVLPGADAYHVPVLADAVRAAFAGLDHIVDGTLGGGGHTALLLEAGHRVTGVDRDPAAREAAATRLAPFVARGQCAFVAATFDDVAVIAPETAGRVHGVLLDLGVSSRQLDDETRGFSFRPGAPLDARMTAGVGPTAADVLNTAPEAALAAAFREHGDEPRARRLAAEVVRRRATAPFVTSDDFVGAIRGALGPRSGAPDFARLFQALRIVVNDEAATLARALERWRDRLAPGGVFAVIAYHSGEDRVVKQAFRAWSTACTCPPRQPLCTCGGVAAGTLMARKAVLPDAAEAAANPRARSARLRLWRKAVA